MTMGTADQSARCVGQLTKKTRIEFCDKFAPTVYCEISYGTHTDARAEQKKNIAHKHKTNIYETLKIIINLRTKRVSAGPDHQWQRQQQSCVGRFVQLVVRLAGAWCVNVFIDAKSYAIDTQCQPADVRRRRLATKTRPQRSRDEAKRASNNPHKWHTNACGVRRRRRRRRDTTTTTTSMTAASRCCDIAFCANIEPSSTPPPTSRE